MWICKLHKGYKDRKCCKEQAIYHKVDQIFMSMEEITFDLQYSKMRKNSMSIAEAMHVPKPGKHATPANHSDVQLPKKWFDYRTDTDGRIEAGQSDPYVPLCFPDDINFLLNFPAKDKNFDRQIIPFKVN